MSDMALLGPRCGQPLKFYDYPGRTDWEPVCWRPAGHASNIHLSRYAIEKRREKRRGTSHKRRR